jgi:hypothetical protein
MQPGIANKAVQGGKIGAFASDAAPMKHPPPPPPAELEASAGQGVMVSPTSAQTEFEKALSLPAVS